MPRPKQKSPEQFIASSPIGEKLVGKVFERKLASGEKLIWGGYLKETSPLARYALLK